MSEHAYAAYRKARGLSGGTQAAVNKAVATGRITKVLDPVTKKPMIDPAIADAQWERNTDQEQAMRSIAVQAPPPPDAMQTSAPRTPAEVLQRVVALAFQDFIEEAAQYWCDQENGLTPLDLVDLARLFAEKLANRADTMLGVAHGAAIRNFYASVVFRTCPENLGAVLELVRDRVHRTL